MSAVSTYGLWVNFTYFYVFSVFPKFSTGMCVILFSRKEDYLIFNSTQTLIPSIDVLKLRTNFSILQSP